MKIYYIRCTLMVLEPYIGYNEFRYMLVIVPAMFLYWRPSFMVAFLCIYTEYYHIHVLYDYSLL